MDIKKLGSSLWWTVSYCCLKYLANSYTEKTG